MAKAVPAIVKPELLIWARATASLSHEEAAKRLRVKPERLLSWEGGDAHPTINQLRNLARIYKRPLAVFYLAEPPSDFKAMSDFRRLPDEDVGRESPQLRYEIRRAQHRRQIALELFNAVGREPSVVPSLVRLNDNPEEAATRLREWLGITYSKQREWRDHYQALNAWRSALEEAGVLVFQVSGVDIREMRGFSISDRPLPVIAVNSKDAPVGRIFSMLHELTHILLNEGGLCNNMVEVRDRSSEMPDVEVFCNRVAGATLVPEDTFLLENLVTKSPDQTEWSDEALRELARRYNTSREVILRRLLILGRTTQSFYRQKRSEWQEEYEASEVTGGFTTPDARAVNLAGHLFARLVLEAYYQEKITASDLSAHLDTRLKHMPKIEERIFGRHILFRASP